MSAHLHTPLFRCLPGRGCCARCWSPFMCGEPACGCHLPQGWVCRVPGCGVGLFIARPEDTRDAAMLAAELAAYAASKRGRKAA